MGYDFSIGIFALAGDGLPDGADDDLDIQPQRPILHVPQIVAGALRDGGVAT